MKTSLPDEMASGYRMPAEWEPHAATWLAWPHYKLDWPDKFE
ncbi:MAG: agmatine deiminase family protein, partial [Acidobacteria bacterium]|nr:agmatine deiminase family protein [Acidobacteriota bacterium]